jgi:hypothetical protein
LSQQYGYATINVASQVGVPVAETGLIAGSACYINAAFFDQTGAPMVPTALRYRLDDVTSTAVILNWTGIVPSATPQVIVKAAQNAIISSSSEFEAHQVTFQFQDAAGNVFVSSAQFLVIQNLPVTQTLNGG